MSLLNSETIASDVDGSTDGAGGVDRLPRKRTFVVLRFGFLLTATYLLLVARDFRPPDLTTVILICAALASNLALMVVPTRLFDGMALTGAVILVDMAMVTAALLISGEFGGQFFLLYFAVLFLAAVGESVPLITLAALVGSAVYFWIGSNQEGGPSFWTSDTLIRFRFSSWSPSSSVTLSSACAASRGGPARRPVALPVSSRPGRRSRGTPASWRPR